MPSSKLTYDMPSAAPRLGVKEEQVEYDFIGKLQNLKYEYRPDIRDRAALERNFREKFEALNRVHLSDGEFARLLDEIVTPDVYTAARTLRERNAFTRDDGTPLNYTLVNIKDWCKNSFEVVNQLRINTDYSHHRYDVLILINGVPCVQVELKTLGISPRRAMEKIVDYKNDPGNGYSKTLLCFLQLFIVSNRTDTWYFANNNTRHFAFNADERFLPIYQFADEANKKITHLDSFAETFLAKCTLGEAISRYMVLVASEQKLLMMRPYQVYAVKAIVDCIHQNCGNGYIWHTTGSGKTLTSFKASTLLKDNPDIEKCLFVVDRKDLDRQTREEFNRFQEGCVEENTNTGALVRRLLSDDHADKVIVTTIQKLGLALDENSKRNKQRKKNDLKTYKEQLEPLSDKRIVFIFDECHRSQFGDNHEAIKTFFPKAQLFGFTGTPIFEKNATAKQFEGEEGQFKTTEDLFQKQLHAYTITHAIEDANVLRFHVDYFKPEGPKSAKAPLLKLAKPGEALAKKAVVEAILAKHDTAAAGRRFNAILATASINDAIEYHRLFDDLQQARQASDPDFQPLNIACVFSPPAEGNADVKQLQQDLPQEKHDNEEDPEGKKAALKNILASYNARYGSNHIVSEFDLYYQDVQKRIKDQQWPNADFPHAKKIDITIVVDMLLTGFDSKYLNTLYVDKNLKYHGLIQAFSRTNRVLNGTKPYGNILDFRQQQDNVDAAIALFSGESADPRAREIWLVDKAPVVIQKLDAAVQKLADFMQSQGLACAPEADDARHIKVSRGEENIFIWCVFMAICERVIDGAESYQWVKYLYIDDPITSLDDNNAIAVASDLAKLLRQAKGRTRPEVVVAGGPGEADNATRMVPAPIKAVVSSHHALFFNVVCNELKKDAHKRYLMQRPERGSTYTLRATDDTPFFHHVAMLAEIQKAAAGGKLYTHHFNTLRSILEKTAIFFGNDDFSRCIHGVDDEVLYARALNLLSHGKYDIYQPTEMGDDNKRLFRQILGAFLDRYKFALPDIFERPAAKARPVPAT